MYTFSNLSMVSRREKFNELLLNISQIKGVVMENVSID